MILKLPRSLIVGLVLAGSGLLWLSIYLENSHLDLLTMHPILVNLLSGAVGFCWASVFIATAINWYIEFSQRFRVALRARFLTRDAVHTLLEVRRDLGGVSISPAPLTESAHRIEGVIHEQIAKLLELGEFAPEELARQHYNELIHRTKQAHIAPANVQQNHWLVATTRAYELLEQLSHSNQLKFTKMGEWITSTFTDFYAIR